MASLFDLYRNAFGGEPDQGAPMAIQNRQGTFDPYTPAPVPDALELLKSATGYTDMSQAYQAAQRGEYLPALGQGAWGAAQAATAALPVLRAGGAAVKAGAPLAREAASALPGLLGDETGAIRAYHGSPHSFDRFDLSKIGTGEGAQAYGHGLYFAENEGVARGYRDTLAGKAPLREYGGQPLETSKDWYGLIDRTAPEDWRLAKIIDAAGKQGGVRSALDTFEPHTRNASDGPLWAAAIERFKEGVGPAAKGHMYEVDINAEPHQFLDWDRALGQQGEYLQNALAVPKGRMPTGSQVTELIRLGKERGVPYTQLPEYQALREQWESATASAKFGHNIDPNAPGSSFYERLIQNMGTPEKASKALRLNDVPGIRYLDQGSRGAGAGTSNYAVFDDKLIQILRKYGIVPPLAGGGLLATQQEQQP